MRNISKVVINKEDIMRYDHDFKQKIITIYVGKGSDDGLGNFIQETSQSLEIFTITGAEYEALIGDTSATNKLANSITAKLLWAAVDATKLKLGVV